MAKEVTLDDLVKSSSNNSKPAARAEETNNAEPKIPESNMVPSSGIKKAKPINMSDLGKNLEAQHPEAQKKIVEQDAPLVANAFAAMDNTLAERKRRINEELMPVVMENAREMAMEKEFGSDTSESNNEEEHITTASELFEGDDFADLDEEPKVENKDGGVYVAPSNPVIEPEVVETKPEVKENKVVKIDKKEESDSGTLDDLMKDLGLDEEEVKIIDTEEETAEELRERFKASLSGIKVTRDPIDLSKFQIAKEPMSSAMVLNAIGSSNKKRCDHPLLHSRRNMTFEECSGPELDALRKTIDNSNGVNGVIASLKFVYNHNIDANKKTFEAWCKSIRTEDIESLYFGMYKACYGDTNLIARADSIDEKKKEGCNKTSLINTPIKDMIKFKDDEAKKLYNDLMNQDTTNPGSKVKSQTMIISDDFAVSYTDPTLYSTFIQYASLKPEIIEKYSGHLNTMAYIDGFYRIDYANQQLIPIAIKEYPTNINKTVMSKLKTYIDILKTLSNDQFNIMTAKLDNVIGEAKISYIYPETTCPECGHTIPEESVDSMLSLLFTRAQLVQVKSL